MTLAEEDATEVSSLKIGIISKPAHAKSHRAALEALGHEVLLLGDNPGTAADIPESVEVLVCRVASCSHEGSWTTAAWEKTHPKRAIFENGVAAIKAAVEAIQQEKVMSVVSDIEEFARQGGIYCSRLQRRSLDEARTLCRAITKDVKGFPWNGPHTKRFEDIFEVVRKRDYANLRRVVRDRVSGVAPETGTHWNILKTYGIHGQHIIIEEFIVYLDKAIEVNIPAFMTRMGLYSTHAEAEAVLRGFDTDLDPVQPASAQPAPVQPAPAPDPMGLSKKLAEIRESTAGKAPTPAQKSPEKDRDRAKPPAPAVRDPAHAVRRVVEPTRYARFHRPIAVWILPVGEEAAVNELCRTLEQDLKRVGGAVRLSYGNAESYNNRWQTAESVLRLETRTSYIVTAAASDLETACPFELFHVSPKNGVVTLGLVSKDQLFSKMAAGVTGLPRTGEPDGIPAPIAAPTEPVPAPVPASDVRPGSESDSAVLEALAPVQQSPRASNLREALALLLEEMKKMDVATLTVSASGEIQMQRVVVIRRELNETFSI